MTPFTLVSLALYGGILVLFALRGPRFFVVFTAIVLGLHTFSATLIAPGLFAYGKWVVPGVWYAQLVTYVYFARLAQGRIRGPWYRVLVSWPASWFWAAVFLALPWAVARALGFAPYALWLPFAIAGFGLLQSLFSRRERRSIMLDGSHAGELRRYDQRLKTMLHRVGEHGQPLRIVQITDPHLGPFMSEARLKGICQRAVDDQPDLIALTGDFLTLESQHSADPLARALSPLAAMSGRVFACFGNHDHECPELVREALARAGVELLVDDAAELALPWGTVQVIGADHVWRGRRQALARLAARFPRKPGALRLWLLHDPGAFQAIPEGEADLVLSGHTHGGHLGLLSLGLPHTVVSAATRMPDHGLWARGRDRLYVHRGTGHYGFPLRIGVPAEESVLEVFWMSESGAADLTAQPS